MNNLSMVLTPNIKFSSYKTFAQIMNKHSNHFNNYVLYMSTLLFV